MLAWIATAFAQSSPPVTVFAELDGSWAGQFVGYDARGKELYRIDVQQTYATVDATTQTVTIRDAMSDGTVITGWGRNIARVVDGRTELSCVVEKSNGDRVRHDGRLVKLPSGEPGLVWSTVTDGRTETFLEYVTEEAGQKVYRIQGTGRYGDTLITMSGRYVRQ